MKATVFNLKGEKSKQIDLPKVFSEKIREDIVSKVLESKKIKQPYSPSPFAGKQFSARGKIRHRRHVWKTHYGKGIARVPRKIFSRRGAQFNWEAASIPSARGGMRAHPPKAFSMMGILKINKKELKKAFYSSISATGNKDIISEKYGRLTEKIKEAPIIVESKVTEIKTKELLPLLKKILGEEIFSVAIKSKKIRSGRGKLRGRKYKKSAGLLIVVGNDESFKTNAFDVKKVKNLGVTDLSKGGLGRLTLYTENAIKDLEMLEK